MRSNYYPNVALESNHKVLNGLLSYLGDGRRPGKEGFHFGSAFPPL